MAPGWQSAAFAALGRSPLPALARRRQRHALVVLCYHGLREAGEAPHWLLVPVPAFARQLAFLREHYDVVPIDEGLARLRAGRLERPTACITFDDGYRNNLTLGLPPLRAAGTPATIYLATGLIGGARTLWTVELELAVAASAEAGADLSAFGGPAALPAAAAARAAAAAAIKARFKRLPAPERRAAHAALLARLGGAPAVPERFALLDWAGVDELAASGLVTFGGHTRTHEIASRLPDGELAAELAGSVADVAARTRAVSHTFAYPNGTDADVDRRAREAVREAGCTAAVTTRPGLCRAGDDPFTLRRVVVGGDMRLDEFAVRCAGLVA